MVDVRVVSDAIQVTKSHRLATAFIVVLLAVYVGVGSAGGEWYPFSTFPMYRTVAHNPFRVRSYEMIGYRAGETKPYKIESKELLRLVRPADRNSHLRDDSAGQLELARELQARANHLHLPGAPFTRVMVRKRLFLIRPYPASPTDLKVLQDYVVADTQPGEPAEEAGQGS
jgi:hypothetical protein